MATTPLNIAVGVKGQQKDDNLNRSLGKTANQSMKLGSALKIAGGALVGFGIAKFAKSVVNVGRDVEELGLRFKFLFGSVEEGARAFDNLIDFAGRVPFTLEEIQKGSGILAVISDGADDLATNLELVGNVAAVTGLDFRTTSEQIQRAFSGGIASADIFRERGVRALLGFKEGAKVSIKETRDAFVRVFGKGGQFGDATDEFAKTLTGTLSMLEDKLFKVKDALAKGFFQELKLQLGDLNKFFEENADAIEDFSRETGEAIGALIINLAKLSKFIKENFSEIELILGTIVAIYGRGLKIILGIAAVIDSLRRELKKLTIDQEQYAKALADTADGVEIFERADLAKIQKKWNDELEDTAKELKNFPFYEDNIIQIKNATKRATAATKEWEDMMKDDVLYQAYKKLNDEFDLQQEKINLVIDTFENFKSTAGNALADVIMGTKRLSDALGEIARQVVHQLISAIIQLGIEIFVIDVLRRKFKDLRNDVANVNSQLRTQLALQAALAVFSGGTSLFGGFFASGGKTAANVPIVVGEAGPELFVPNTGGSIIPNDQLGAGMGDNINVTFNIQTIDATDFDTLLTTRQDLIIGLINRGLAERGKRSILA